MNTISAQLTNNVQGIWLKVTPELGSLSYLLIFSKAFVFFLNKPPQRTVFSPWCGTVPFQQMIIFISKGAFETNFNICICSLIISKGTSDSAQQTSNVNYRKATTQNLTSPITSPQLAQFFIAFLLIWKVSCDVTFLIIFS